MTENERVREIRKAKSLTMEKFGERLGVTRSAIANIESGNRNMSDQLRRSICREFNINEEWLRTGEGEMMAEVAEDALIDSFIADIKLRPDFRKRLVSLLAQLPPESWAVLEDMAKRLAAEEEVSPAPMTPEEEARAKADEYYERLLEEKKPESPTSSVKESAAG